MDFNTILLAVAILAGVYMACNIGANDVANAMGTSVGSKALTFQQAIMIAAVAEFAGAFLVGGHVSDTIRKCILDPVIFQDTPLHLVYGMIASLVAAGVDHPFHCGCGGGFWDRCRWMGCLELGPGW